MGGLFLIPSSCPGSLEWICFSWCKLWKYRQGQEKRKTIVTGVSSSEKKKIILHQTCISADLQTQLENSCAPPCTEPLSWTRGVKLCPVFSLKAQRRAVSKLLMNSKQSSLSSLCAVSWGHDQGDNQPPSWNLWGLLCSSSSALINSLCSSSWKLNCSVLPEIQSSAESFSIAFHWQRRTRFFREMHACCSSREHAEHTGLIKSLWEGISMLTHVL